MLKSIYFHELIGVPDTVQINESFSLYDSLTKLRMTDKNNNNYYYLVLQFFKSLLYGVSRVNYLKDYKKKCLNTRISDIITADEEALGLWLLDNSEKKWRNKFLLKHDNENYKHKVKLCDAKYTQCISGHHPFQGWTNEGIQQYAIIKQLVEQDRSSNHCVIFEEEFMKSQRKDTVTIMMGCQDNRPKKEIAHSLQDVSYDNIFQSMNIIPEMPSLQSSSQSSSHTSELTGSGIPSSISTNGSKKKSNKSKYWKNNFE